MIYFMTGLRRPLRRITITNRLAISCYRRIRLVTPLTGGCTMKCRVVYTPRTLKLDRQHLAEIAGGECRMLPELHAGDGAAGLRAVEGGLRTKAVRAGERAPIGKAAARGGG